jgi:hypothetical protein
VTRDKLVSCSTKQSPKGGIEVAGRLDTYAFQPRALRDFLRQLGRIERARLHQRVTIRAGGRRRGADRDSHCALLALPLATSRRLSGWR